jgi:hypothetical protein
MAKWRQTSFRCSDTAADPKPNGASGRDHRPPGIEASVGSVICCRARNRSGGYCRRICAPGRTRCFRHGGLAVGPRSFTARLAAGERLKRYRVTGNARKGIPNGTKIKDRKARGAENRVLVAARHERRRERLAAKRQAERIVAGLPLWTEAELEKLE